MGASNGVTAAAEQTARDRQDSNRDADRREATQATEPTRGATHQQYRKNRRPAISEREIERELGEFLRAKGVEVWDQDGETFIVTVSLLDDDELVEISLADLARRVVQLLGPVP